MIKEFLEEATKIKEGLDLLKKNRRRTEKSN